MKILSCSDVHLTNYSAFNQPTEYKEIGSRLEKILKALDYFFEYGVKHKITKFVINGDLFDQRQRDNPTTLASIRYYLIGHFKHLEVANNEPYELYINVGNHDEFGRTSYPNAIQDFELYSDNEHKIYVFNDVSMKCFDDSNLFFIPYSEHVDELKADIKKSLKQWNNGKPIVVFAHLGVTGGVQGRWHHRLSDAFNVTDLGWNNQNVKLITLGHFHTRSTVKQQDNKEAFYQGDLTELNFNDIQANGLGAPRGFDEIDTVTGKHKFIDLTKYADYPDNIPTFNLIDLDNPNQKVDYLNLLKQGNYLKLITKSKDTYDKVNQVIQKQPLFFNAQLVYQPEIKEQTDFKVQANSSSKELVAEYCKQHCPELKKQALNYLERANNQ